MLDKMRWEWLGGSEQVAPGVSYWTLPAPRVALHSGGSAITPPFSGGWGLCISDKQEHMEIMGWDTFSSSTFPLPLPKWALLWKVPPPWWTEYTTYFSRSRERSFLPISSSYGVVSMGGGGWVSTLTLEVGEPFSLYLTGKSRRAGAMFHPRAPAAWPQWWSPRLQQMT